MSGRGMSAGDGGGVDWASLSEVVRSMLRDGKALNGVSLPRFGSFLFPLPVSLALKACLPSCRLAGGLPVSTAGAVGSGEGCRLVG